MTLRVPGGAAGASQTADTTPAAAGLTNTSATHISAATVRAGSSLYALVKGASLATTAADAAGAAGSSVLDLLQQMRQTAADAAAPSLSSADRRALDASFQQAAGQIGPTLGGSAGAAVATATAAAPMASPSVAKAGAAGSALGTLDSQAEQITAHVGFVQNYSQALASPSDDGGDSVRLLALQLSQQLSTQTTAVANASPQSILSLFRN